MSKLKLRLNQAKQSLTTRKTEDQGTILLVDDEQANLDGLAAVLNSKYKIFQTTNAYEALGILEHHEVDLIITDQRMPMMLGTELLQALSTRELKCSQHLNILLTGYTDIDDLITCINDGLLYRYLVKPWSPQELLVTVKQAFDKIAADRELEIKSQELHREIEERRRAQTELEIALQELRETQETLITQEKLRVLGEMVSGVAHDFSNLLTPIKAYCEELIDSFQDHTSSLSTQEVLEDLNGIHNASIDGVMLIQRLKSSYHPQYRALNLTKRTLIKPLIQSAIKLAFPRWSSSSPLPQLELEVEDHLEIEVNVSDLRQALVNLICNALDAIADQQERGDFSQALKLMIRAWRSGSECVIEVMDEGIGMNSEVLAQCQQTFFSTKGEVGTGLGLPMVNEMVKRHGGQLTIKSQSGKGTVITLSLPLISPHESED